LEEGNKWSIGVVMVADGSDKSIRAITQRAINTAQDEGVTVLIVETGPKVSYDNCLMIYHKNNNFNYNHCLNIGAAFIIGYMNPDYIAFCNNDLVFHRGWSGIVGKMSEVGYRSASPWCPRSHPRYFSGSKQKILQGSWTRKNLAGWCFIWEKELYKQLGGINEDYTFYCSDNATEKQLRENRIAHALFRDYQVEHIGSQTLKLMDAEFKKNHCDGQVKKWNKENNVNMFNLGV